jgi:aarF domain-containing kinase
VAIKVQYPGVKQSIDSDLNNLKNLMIYTKAFPKSMFLDKLINYSRKELHEECDYVIEAKKQNKMKTLLANYPEYHVPELIS